MKLHPNDFPPINVFEAKRSGGIRSTLRSPWAAVEPAVSGHRGETRVSSLLASTAKRGGGPPGGAGTKQTILMHRYALKEYSHIFEKIHVFSTLNIFLGWFTCPKPKFLFVRGKNA